MATGAEGMSGEARKLADRAKDDFIAALTRLTDAMEARDSEAVAKHLAYLVALYGTMLNYFVERDLPLPDLPGNGRMH